MADARSDALIMQSKPSDPARDFCQWPYRRPHPITADSLRQESILWEAARQADSTGRLTRYLLDAQRVTGRFGIVWGIKWSGSLSFELYFYDYARDLRKIGPKRIRDELPGVFDFPHSADESIPFFMWSTEASADQGYRFANLELYCNGTGGSISGGICYSLSDGFLELKNLYYFFERGKDKNMILERLESSPNIVDCCRLPDFVNPAFAPGEIYVVSQKRRHDGIYLSRVPLRDTIDILERSLFSEELINYLQENFPRFQHHLFDIGLDFVKGSNSLLSVGRVALFGLL